LVVIYPYKFHNFVHTLLELDQFKWYCDVEVWDASTLLTPEFAKAVSSARSTKEGVLAVTTWRGFLSRVGALRRQSYTTNICVINEVPNNSIREFFANLVISALLRSTRVAIVDLYNGGVPLRDVGLGGDVEAVRPAPTFVAKVKRALHDTSSLRETAKTIRTAIFVRISRMLPSSTTHRLVAGEDWEELATARTRGNGRITIVAGHSHDHSNNLLRERMGSPAPPELRTGVMLDGAGPMFGSDAALLGRKVYFTSEMWYPALCRLFDRIEAGTGARVEIAGHYKTTHPPIAEYFGNRRVHYGKTWELVRSSDFVITRASTAISYAIAHRKPIVLIYSNQLANDKVAMRQGHELAAMLDRRLVNIDDIENLDVAELLRVNDERYAAYERACLTSNRGGPPNVQIILEEIMRIPTGPELYGRG
jgi:hypothetical protein